MHATRSTLTFDSIVDLMGMLPPAPKPQIYVARPAVVNALRAQSEPSLSSLDFFGLQIFAKPGQIADAWAFSDRAIALRYLDGEITEADLVRMTFSPTSKPIAAAEIS